MAFAKILLVEDDIDLNEILKEQLQLLGCEVDSATDGKMAVEIAKNNSYTCIISDIKMPKLDGMQMKENLNELNIHTPVVFITGFSEYTNDQISKAGGVALIEKPFNTLQLKELVEMYIDVLPNRVLPGAA